MDWDLFVFSEVLVILGDLIDCQFFFFFFFF